MAVSTSSRSPDLPRSRIGLFPQQSGLNCEGPRVCVDAGHHNFHTLDGRYYAFGKLLRGDGFATASLAATFSEAALADCDVLVIANATAAENAAAGDDRAARLGASGRPHPSAFGREEIRALVRWVREGGRLLLIMDHTPWPGAAADLASLLGALPLDGGAGYSVFGQVDEEAVREAAEEAGITPERLRQMLGTPGALGDHPILEGRRGVDPPVRTLEAFGGSVFLPSEAVRPLLIPPPGAPAVAMDRNLPRAIRPRYPSDHWLVGGARTYGEGRVVFLGEAAMCTAQRAGPRGRRAMGMNHPLAVDNPRFCLNVVRWLAGVLGG